jgi:CRISPR-associated endonuclease Csn1
MLNKNGDKVNQIRHIRVYSGAKKPLRIKEHRDLNPGKEYKHFYYAENGDNFACVLYQKDVMDKKGEGKVKRDLEIISLKEVADLLSNGLLNEQKEIEISRKDDNGNNQKPYAILKAGLRVIFYDENIEELKQTKTENIEEYIKRINPRIYHIVKFSGVQITFQHHLEARSNDAIAKAYPKDQVYMTDEKGKEIKYGVGGTSGFTKAVSDAMKHNGMNNYQPSPRLLYSKEWLDMAIEGKHFEIKPDGMIEWKISL